MSVPASRVRNRVFVAAPTGEAAAEEKSKLVGPAGGLANDRGIQRRRNQPSGPRTLRSVILTELVNYDGLNLAVGVTLPAQSIDTSH